MLNNVGEIFPLKEVALQDTHLLSGYKEKVIYFVTAMQGEIKTFLYIGFTANLSKKFENHHRQVEFEFLNRIGCQIKISWFVLPNGIREKEGQAMQMCYIRALEPRLNDERNCLAALQKKEMKRQKVACIPFENQHLSFASQQVTT